ncbi:hypothetical protein [Streptomyces sp. NPDC005805]|uniref:hypothetical protein n=1 Tax=Streptomyces sp. NPDC005805 TaxID=3157068 RepID=UPI0033F67FFD
MAAVPAPTPDHADAQGPPRLTGDWLTRGRDGVLTAWAPGDDAVLRWTRWGTGAPGPERLPAPGLLPPLAVTQGADGYVHLVGVRRVRGGETLELVHAVQFQTGRPLLGWTALGHPNKAPKETGRPVTAVDGEGRLYVALRNGGTGLSCRNQKVKGGWAGWQDLGGKGVRDTPAAAVDGKGRVELYAAEGDAVVRFTQEKPGAAFERAAELGVRAEPGAFTALTGPSGAVELFFTDAEGTIRVWAPERGPDARPLLPAAGPGAPALAAVEIDGHDCTVLAQETPEGQVAFAAYPSGDEEAGAWWTPTDPARAGVRGGGLALALCAHGEEGLVGTALGASGEPVVIRQKKDAGGFAVGRWKPLA